MEVEAASWTNAGLLPPQVAHDLDRGDSPMPDLPDQENLVRVTSNGSSIISGGSDPDVELHRVRAQGGRNADEGGDESMPDAPVLPDPPPTQPSDPEAAPQQPSGDSPDNAPPAPQAADGAEQKKEPDDDFHWVQIFEDTSSPGIDELKRLESAGELSALDSKHWEGRVYKDLDDPAYEPVASGRIEWTVERFNGTQEKPSKELLRYSNTVKIGDHHWRIKLYPKGNGTSHVAAYVELVDFVDKGTESSSDKGFEADKEPAKKERFTSEILDSPMPTIGNAPIRKPLQVPAQIMIMMYNPQEPRVHWHKKSNHAFTPNDPDRGFSRVGSSPIYDLGLRAPDTRQAMLRNDTLAFIAYVRVFKDHTGFLFVKEDYDYRRDFARTGLRPVNVPQDSRGPASNLAAAVATWALLPMMRSLIYRGSKYDLSKMPLTKALQEFLAHWRRQPPEEFDSPPIMPAPLRQVASALHWHGSCVSPKTCKDASHVHGTSEISPDSDKVSRRKFWHPAGRGMQDFDMFQIWEFMLDILDTEWRGTEMAGALQKLFDPNGFRARLSSKSKDIQSSLFHRAMTSGQRSFPPLIQVELPRCTFDEESRKWKKTDDKIGLGNALKLSKDESGWYTLYALILHDGNLASRQFTPIIRPDGRNWYRIQTHRSSRINRITDKQAISDNDARAYVAVYLRTDMLHNAHHNSADPFKGYPENDWVVPENLQKEEERPKAEQCNCASCREERGETQEAANEENKETENGAENTEPTNENSDGQTDATANDASVPEESNTQNEKQAEQDEASAGEDKQAQATPEESTEMALDGDEDEQMSDEIRELDYFASGYYRGTLHHGYMHGKGRRIFKNGDTFEGDFVRDDRQGRGQQVYQNGDIYEGDWENDKPHGSGTRTTSATGHVYHGGFKNGKPFGEFTVTGTKAETLKGCLVCYEQERDAVFYPCGHMCACLDCARKLDDCPYCHKSISESIRLYAI
ncbi:MAG: hypothetical protein Q9162_001281 [Coniocarpon cinnabarinum]